MSDSSPKAGPSREAGVLIENQERLLLMVLAAVQFTHILDFMIIMPLGPQFMRVFGITPAQFGLLVSAYTFSAAAFGLVAAWFIDRFERKPALIFLYSGFVLGTLLCALSPSYFPLLAARILAGGFGGVSGVLVLAIIGDVIPLSRRGAAMGRVMSAFALASILGVPLGLYLANHLGWHSPFFLLAGLGALLLPIMYRILPAIPRHKAPDTVLEGVPEAVWRPLRDMKAILVHSNHQRAFALTLLMTASGFLVIPYISPYMVANAGLTEGDLPYLYLFGGLFTFFTMPMFGKMGDRHGLLRIFIIMNLLAIIPTLAITNLPESPLALAVGITTLFMIFSSGRMVQGMAMVTGSVEPKYRGGFLSINSSVQQFSSGLAAFVSGFIIIQAPGGRLLNYEWVGGLAVAAGLASLWMASRIRLRAK